VRGIGEDVDFDDPAALLTRTGVPETPACRNINASPAAAAAPRNGGLISERSTDVGIEHR